RLGEVGEQLVDQPGELRGAERADPSQVAEQVAQSLVGLRGCRITLGTPKNARDLPDSGQKYAILGITVGHPVTSTHPPRQPAPGSLTRCMPSSPGDTRGSVTDFDTILKDGIVVDGTRSQRYRADVGIRAGRIARIGRLRSSDGARVLDASGMIV